MNKPLLDIFYGNPRVIGHRLDKDEFVAWLLANVGRGGSGGGDFGDEIASITADVARFRDILAGVDALNAQPEERPGDAPSFFGAKLDGEPELIAPYSAAATATTTDGAALIVGPALTPRIVAPRTAYAIEAGVIYGFRLAVRRLVDTIDPSGDAVRLGLAWLDKDKALISTATIYEAPLTTFDGLLVRGGSFARSGAVDHVAPAGAIYMRPFAEIFGASGRTAVLVERVVESAGLPGPPGPIGDVTPAAIAARDQAVAAAIAAQQAVAGLAQLAVTLEGEPGFDPDNAHIAAQSIAARFAGARALHIVFLGRDYTFRQVTTFTCKSVLLEGVAGHRLIVTDGVTAEKGAFEFGSQAALEPTGAARQAVTSIAGDRRSMVVADGSQFPRGTIGKLVSGSGPSSGEYKGGITGQNGYEPYRKVEKFEVERAVGNTVYFLAPLMEAFNTADYAVEARRYAPQGDDIIMRDLNWYGSGGANLHQGVSTPPTGPRAFNVWGFRRVSYLGGHLANFGRFGGMFYDILESGLIDGASASGYDANDPSNFKSGDPAFRSVWFTGFYICGATENWIESGRARNMRRLCDVDRGPGYPRNILVIGTVHDNCEYASSGHIADSITYVDVVGLRCRNGALTRARDTKFADLKIQCERYGLQPGPISGGGITWPVEQANIGTIDAADIQLEVSSGEYVATYMSFDRFSIRNLLAFGSRDTTGRHAIDIQARIMRNLLIDGVQIDMSLAGLTGSLGDCLYIGDGDPAASGNNAGVLAVQDGISIDNAEFIGGATAIRIRGVSKDAGAPLAERSRNIVIGNGNKYRDQKLRDIRFEQGAFDGSRVRVLPGQSFGSRAEWPRISLGNDRRRFSEMPISDPTPIETKSGRMTGLILPTVDGDGVQIPFTTHRAGQRYRNMFPAAGQPESYIVTEDGTRGLLVNVAGTIAAVSKSLTVSNASGIFTGCYVSIAGAGAVPSGGSAPGPLIARVESVSGVTVVLDTAAVTAVTSAAVIYKSSVILGVGLIA